MDVRTTPPWARIPGLAALALLIAYFAACYAYALGDPPRWAVPGGWQMFTKRGDARHFDIVAYAEVDGAWSPVDLDALFPSRWENGPRYLNGFRFRKEWQHILADSTCRRDPRHPAHVRFVVLDWPQEPGVAAAEHHDLTRQRLFDWTCGDPVVRPGGLRL